MKTMIATATSVLSAVAITLISGLWGGGNETTHVMLSASYIEERDIGTVQ